MTQSPNQKIIIQSTVDFVKTNKNLVIGLGLAFLGLAVFSSTYRKRIHPDIIKVMQMRSTISKSYTNALQSLQSLNIEKRILTEYGNQEEHKNDQQLNMLYLLITRLKLKEMNKQKELRNPFLPPFQDGLFITELQPTHRLLYNKFNIFKNHLLVVTKQFQAQTNQLNPADFKQSILILKALEGLLFFNSGTQAGSSQPHKHVQIFPTQALQLPIVKKIIEFVKSKQKQYNYNMQQIIQFPGFNFIHGLILLKPQQSLSAAKKQMYNSYKRILQQKIYKINAAAYNIIATQEFILVVARSKQKAFDQIAVNSVGFMGSLLFKDQQKLNRYLSLKIKPSSILSDITYPKSYVPPQAPKEDIKLQEKQQEKKQEKKQQKKQG